MGLLLPACLPVSYPPEPVPASQARAIVQGTDAPGDAAAVALVARRTRCGGEPPVLLCSGALIAPDVVLTAAHCLSVFGAEGPYEVFLGPTLLPEPAAGGRFVRVTRAVVHPAHVPATHAYDAALLRLATPVNDLPPFRLPDATGAPVAVGSSVRAVGYGDTKDAARPSGQRRQGQLQVTGVGPASFQAGPAPGMSCVGDSGGPVLGAAQGGPGTEVLWGLTVSGDVACRSEAVQVRVDALEDFLRPFLEAAPPPATPAPLALDALCQEACAADAECPAGLLCVAAGDAPARCLLPALQAGTFGAACSEDAACGAQGVCARLEVEGDAACRCFTPCEVAMDPPTPGDGPPEPGGGCAQAPGALGGMGVVLLGLFGRLRRQSHQRTSRCRSRDDSA